MTDHNTKITFSIDTENLNDEMTRLPGDLAWLNADYAQAHARWLRAKANRDRVIATASIRARDKITESGSKPTEATISAMVENDVRVIGAVEATIDADEQTLLARGRSEACRAKRDMLMMLGASFRAERAPIHTSSPSYGDDLNHHQNNDKRTR